MADGHGTELLELAEELDVPGHRGAGGPGRQLGHGLPHPSAGPGARRGRAQPQAAGVKGTLRPLARRHAAFAAPLPAVSEASQPITVRGRKATKAHGPGSNETAPLAAARQALTPRSPPAPRAGAGRQPSSAPCVILSTRTGSLANIAAIIARENPPRPEVNPPAPPGRPTTPAHRRSPRPPGERRRGLLSGHAAGNSGRNPRDHPDSRRRATAVIYRHRQRSPFRYARCRMPSGRTEAFVEHSPLGGWTLAGLCDSLFGLGVVCWRGRG
jgi:hypothetical protein